MAITPELLESIDSFEALASKLFHDELGWPKPNWETFPGVPKLYGLSENDIPGVVNLSAVQKFEDDQDWGIFLVDFGDSELKRNDLRRILNKVAEKARAQHDNPTWPHDKILFVCRSKFNNWTFAYFTGDKLANVKLRTFGWTDPQRARTTLTRNLPKLDWTQRATWHSAWDAEALTKAFFTDYRAVFENVERMVVGTEGDDRRRFTQALFNRLMFLCFLQEKGWLEFESERKDYLFRLYKQFRPVNKKGGFSEIRFYDRLRLLFFSGLNAPNEEGGKRADLEPFIGNVPFLNGGLFEEDKGGLDSSSIHVPDEAFEQILPLFERYTFTVTESTPMDIEVALDPEMLGKIFEELVTGRHATGSYYTPRPIVSFMCREALKGYLGGYEKLVDEHDAEGIAVNEARELIRKLESIKVCDPACGSGAYLLGMLQEIHALQVLLDTRAHERDARDDYSRKVRIIENCLYGVDIDPFAINIAWLRLWLALVIDDQRDPLNDDVSLPNLDVKIEVGDSLLAQDPGIVLKGEQQKTKKVYARIDDATTVREQAAQYQSGLVRQVIDDFRKEKGVYMRAHTKGRKDELRRKMDDSRKAIRQFLKTDPPEGSLDWVVEFVEVFVPEPQQATIGGRLNLGPRAGKNLQGELAEPEREGGFDAVLANPPYVRHELIKDIKPALRSVYGDFYSGTADLYTYFYARAHQLLRPGGMLVFISSNKWFRAAYGANLRRLMADQTHVRSITDFGELPVFLTAATFPMIFVTQKCSTGVPPVSGTAEHAWDAHATKATDEITIRQGAYLPHWTRDGGIYHVVFRLHDSLPQAVVREWLAERDDIRRNAEAQNRELTDYETRRLAELHSEKVEGYLDQGHGECYFKRDDCAKVMADALLHFNGDRYHVHTWCVMPNHVHVVVEPTAGHKLPDILHSWKSFTAHKINKLLDRTGEFWQPEYYDHLIRDEKDYSRCVQYVLDNPAAAGLKNWKWVGGGGTGVPAVVEGDGHARDAHATTATIFTQVKSLDPPYPDVAALIAESGIGLPADALRGSEWRLVDAETAARMRRMEARGVPLGEYVKGKIYYGIKTGFNEAFVIDGAKRAELIAEDPKSAEIIKPLAVGDDVRKWRIRKRDVWLIFTRRGVDLDRYPAIKSHLMQWRTELEPRPRDWKPSKPGEEWPGRKRGSYKWFEIQDDIAYYAEFDKPKIVFPDIAMEPRFAFDRDKTSATNTTYMAISDDLCLLGVLNSVSMWWYCGEKLTVIGDVAERGRLRFFRQFVELLPIPRASAADCAAMEALVQQILDLKAADPAADVSQPEAEIDARVEFLYFHQDEAPTYDEWLAKREAEKGTEIEEIRKRCAIGHETDQFECKASFSYDMRKGEQADWLKDEVHIAICAMLNAKGGELLVGVDDDMNIAGLEKDLERYGNKDKLIQAIEGPLGKTLTANPIGLVDIKAIDIDGKIVIRVKVKPDNTERYRFKDQIYVRRNSKSKPALTADEAASWWPKRQRGEV